MVLAKSILNNETVDEWKQEDVIEEEPEEDSGEDDSPLPEIQGPPPLPAIQQPLPEIDKGFLGSSLDPPRVIRWAGQGNSQVATEVQPSVSVRESQRYARWADPVANRPHRAQPNTSTDGRRHRSTRSCRNKTRHAAAQRYAGSNGGTDPLARVTSP